MSQIQSFAPIADDSATVLILGSMPGIASLQAGQYYAHPRNLFWHMMESAIALDPHAPYEQRTQALSHANVALWDVLHSCTRDGSLDADIDKPSRIPNNFQEFFARYRQITHVYFNGATAEQSYRKLVLPGLAIQHIEYLRLPSTSPANASVPYEHKLAAWQAIRCESGMSKLD